MRRAASAADAIRSRVARQLTPDVRVKLFKESFGDNLILLDAEMQDREPETVEPLRGDAALVNVTLYDDQETAVVLQILLGLHAFSQKRQILLPNALFCKHANQWAAW